MPTSINGIGTTFYGRALEEPDGSYVVTEWIVFVFVPLIPIGSKRVWPIKDDTPWWRHSGGQKFKAAKVPLHKPHVWKGYAALAGVAIFLMALG